MPKKRSGDNYPTDLKGQMIFIGSIVCVPFFARDMEGNGIPQMCLGYVSKTTQKRGVDVVVFFGYTENGKLQKNTMRFELPNVQVNVIEKSQLKVMDKFHEEIRMAAALKAAE